MLVLPFSDIAVEIVEDSPFATSDNLFNEEKIFITIKKHLPPLKSTVLLIIKDIEKDLDSQE